MQKIGIKEFRDNATKLLATGESMLIERHGHPVGYFIPIKKDTCAVEKGMARLLESLELAINESGLDEEQLAELFAIKRDDASSR